MDIEEFKRSTMPTKKLDSLNHYKEGLFDLRYSGYSYTSLSNWLCSNKIEVSEHTVRRFFSRYATEYASYVSRVK